MISRLGDRQFVEHFDLEAAQALGIGHRLDGGDPAVPQGQTQHYENRTIVNRHRQAQYAIDEGQPGRLRPSMKFGVGLGSFVLLINVVLLGGYTLGCHSLRHLVGGYLDRLSGAPVRKKTYDCVSCLNRGHLRWAWLSLFWVAFSDIFIRLCAMGVWHDVRLI